MLLRLRKTLLTQVTNLRHQLEGELSNLHNFRTADSPGDSVDGAFESSGDDMASRLAELNAHELSQTEQAVDCLSHGTYGMCQGGGKNCQKRIPLARLKALPHTTLCINCERELDKYPDWQERRANGHWDGVFDSDESMDDPRVTLSELEINLPRKR
ncbi:hypothetical protein AYO40_06060 [Planctomycetaceae bacterium SCGC AG-212-D15]|nr:hypothetical protein AYO40_06060 [Planctomycetaceae bacterium SCGC AG-212-D15]